MALEGQVERGYREVAQAHGRPGILVHAAGIVGPTSTRITDYPTEAFDEIYAVNLRGTFLMAKYALQAMEPA